MQKWGPIEIDQGNGTATSNFLNNHIMTADQAGYGLTDYFRPIDRNRIASASAPGAATKAIAHGTKAKASSPGDTNVPSPPPPGASLLIEGLSPEQIAMGKANQNQLPPPPPLLDKEHREHLKRQTAALETISDHTKELKESQKAAMVHGATGTLIANQQYILQGRQ